MSAGFSLFVEFYKGTHAGVEKFWRVICLTLFLGLIVCINWVCLGQEGIWEDYFLQF